MMKVACVGILVADVIVDSIDKFPNKGELLPVNAITVHNGGNAMTASINLKKLGVSSSMVGKIGNDMFGTYLKNVLVDKNVDITGLKIDDGVQNPHQCLGHGADAFRLTGDQQHTQRQTDHIGKQSSGKGCIQGFPHHTEQVGDVGKVLQLFRHFYNAEGFKKDG